MPVARSARIALSGSLLLGLTAALHGAASLPTRAARDLPANVQAAIDHISSESMRDHLKYIASDELAGRDTPSPGLDLAAEYIARQFEAAGLEPVGGDGYFQTASLSQRTRTPDQFAASITIDGERIEINAENVSVRSADGPIDAASFEVLKVPADDDGALGRMVEGGPHPRAVLLTEFPDLQSLPRDQRRAAYTQSQRVLSSAALANIRVVLSIDRANATGTGIKPGRNMRGGQEDGQPALLSLHGRQFAALYDSLDTGVTGATASIRLEEPKESDVGVRNVVGLLPGSDPDLRDQYIIVTAHYDHIGIGRPVNGDNIYNGANDDGSGTVSVIEIAGALSRLEPRPKRSILFMCVYGEERGLLGSRHYAANPIFPLEQTIANVNLEHMGRTDDSEGANVNGVFVTGFDYSSLTDRFQPAAAATGVELIHHPRNSASFFARSDNVAFAQRGIPAHTFCTSFIFPDYHGAGDHWNKVNYGNMERINRMIAAGLVELANHADVPRWTEDHRATSRYIRAWKRLHGE